LLIRETLRAHADQRVIEPDRASGGIGHSDGSAGRERVGGGESDQRGECCDGCEVFHHDSFLGFQESCAATACSSSSHNHSKQGPGAATALSPIGDTQ
jgi:hypothetical protein